jgi:hypothetical protein
MKGDEKITSKRGKLQCGREDPLLESRQRLACRRRLAEFKNMCMLDGDIHNWWEARFFDVPDKGPFQRAK